MLLFQHINICNNISIHIICVDDTTQTGILPMFVKIGFLDVQQYKQFDLYLDYALL